MFDGMAELYNVQNFLKKSNLSQYFESFCDQEYDDLGQILSFANDHAELHSLMGDVGLSYKGFTVNSYIDEAGFGARQCYVLY